MRLQFSVLGRLWKGGHALYCLQGNPSGGIRRPGLQYPQTANEKHGRHVTTASPASTAATVHSSLFSRCSSVVGKIQERDLTGEPLLKIPLVSEDSTRLFGQHQPKVCCEGYVWQALHSGPRVKRITPCNVGGPCTIKTKVPCARSFAQVCNSYSSLGLVPACAADPGLPASLVTDSSYPSTCFFLCFYRESQLMHLCVGFFLLLELDTRTGQNRKCPPLTSRLSPHAVAFCTRSREPEGRRHQMALA